MTIPMRTTMANQTQVKCKKHKTPRKAEMPYKSKSMFAESTF